MKTTSLLFLFLGTVLISCLKKGEDDPAISLKTRENRLKGEWKPVSGEISYKWADTTISWTLAASKMKFKFNNIFIGEYNYSQTFSFNKDGKFSRAINEGGDDYSDEGYWFFGGKNNNLSLKNEETLFLAISTHNSRGTINSWVGINTNEAYTIQRLSNKSLIIKREFSYYDTKNVVIFVNEYWEYEKKKNKLICIYPPIICSFGKSEIKPYSYFFITFFSFLPV